MSLPQIPGGRFEVRKLLGSGSFGAVYEAFDHQRNRTVALKVLERVSTDSIARFKREFRVLAELRHPNLVSLYELAVLGEYWVLSMELIRGTELLEHLAFVELQQSFLEARTPTQPEFDGDATIVLRAPAKTTKAISPLYVEQVRETFRQIAIAIATLHARGVVHRDIKPSNIMITGEGRIVILDFGLVAEVSLEDTIDRRTVVGTPGYMSPEQVIASPPAPPNDWYGFGVLLYQALTAQMPFGGQTALEIVEHQMHDEAPRAGDVVEGVPEDLSALAHECLQRDPSKRPSDEAILERMRVRSFDPERMERTRDRATELIGRGREKRRLHRLLDSLEPGTPRIVLLHGSPGVGKSALAGRFLDEVRESGKALILAGCCHAFESMPLNAIDSIVEAVSREIRRQKSPAVDEILSRAISVTEVFPALATESSGDVGEATIALPTGEKLIARAVSELNAIVHKLAGDRPILILLDDAQWGDYQSAQVLTRIFQRAGDQRLMLVLSYRTEDWRTSLLLQSLLNGNLTTSEVELKPLTRSMTGRVGDAAGIRRKRLADAIFQQSGGNPALIEMMSDVFTHSGGDPKALLARAIGARASKLSAAARRLFALTLKASSPIGEESAEGDLELFEIDEPIRALKNARLIRITRTGDLREISIYHPLLRDALNFREARSRPAGR
ncbi:MAG: serine/threonine-protein kinase PknK [Thermoanaerobaculia bacterium]|nr:serine/threonine-protein kinase PknK [Thermoanaerobaculia bacterium]